MNTLHTTVGQMAATCYEEAMSLYGDPELAAVIASAVLNDLLAARSEHESESAA